MVVTPNGKVNSARLKKMICSTLDDYLNEDRVPANRLHQAARKRHGKEHQTPGYFLRLYRQRADLTQGKLSEHAGIRQHHLSEMEHNKRPLGKANVNKLADILDCDYRNLF